MTCLPAVLSCRHRDSCSSLVLVLFDVIQHSRASVRRCQLQRLFVCILLQKRIKLLEHEVVFVHHLRIFLPDIAVMVLLSFNSRYRLLLCGIPQHKAVFPAVVVYPRIAALTRELGVCALVGFVQLKIHRQSRQVLIAAVRTRTLFGLCRLLLRLCVSLGSIGIILGGLLFLLNIELRLIHLIINPVSGISHHYGLQSRLCGKVADHSIEVFKHLLVSADARTSRSHHHIALCIEQVRIDRLKSRCIGRIAVILIVKCDKTHIFQLIVIDLDISGVDLYLLLRGAFLHRLRGAVVLIGAAFRSTARKSDKKYQQSRHSQSCSAAERACPVDIIQEIFQKFQCPHTTFRY